MNNYSEFIEFIKNIENRPKLLLHSCCGVCSGHVLTLLDKYFDITIYYTNSNIHPKEEFDRRVTEQKKVIDTINKDIKIIIDIYNPNDYNEAIKGYENLKEFSKRCYLCYEFRLKKTANYAKNNNFPYFTTTLSISPYKNSKWINEIGLNEEKSSNVKFIYSDFKKDNGYIKTLDIAKRFNIYRQDYCGCIYSLKEKEEREKSVMLKELKR